MPNKANKPLFEATNHLNRTCRWLETSAKGIYEGIPAIALLIAIVWVMMLAPMGH